MPTYRYTPEEVLIGEAASEGPEGMLLVGDTFYNRGIARKLPIEAIVAQPKQYSAYDRADLKEFVAKQPPYVRSLAEAIIADLRKTTYQPQTPAQHYMTKDLYDSEKRPSWAKNMEPMVVGNHVFLIEKPKKK